MKKVGILITHGTDTLAWTHAFLRYSIKNNHANIVITGSQIPMPSLGEFSDAYENLENSIHFLVSLVPPNIITVFNYGKEAFSDSLRKVNRWDNNAFIGDVIAKMEWDEIKYHDRSVEIKPPETLDKFYLITTGGTIESDYNEAGILVPGQNHVLAYISRRFSQYFKDLSQDPVFTIDSSDLTFNRMVQICLKVEKCLKESNRKVFADLAFDEYVRIVYTDPYKRTDDYLLECENAKGVVIAGYGGGNVTIDENTNQNLLVFIRSLVSKKIPVILSSQVPVGPSDIVYKNAYDAILAGAISAVDLSLPECQVRLSYMLGHVKQIMAMAEASKMDFMEAVERMFMSGVKFRTQKSRRLYEKIRNYHIIEEDLLINHTFEEAVELFENGL